MPYQTYLTLQKFTSPAHPRTAHSVRKMYERKQNTVDYVIDMST